MIMTVLNFWQGTALGSVVGGIYNNWGTSNNKINEPDDSGGQDALGLALTEWPFNFPFFRLGNAGQWNDVDHTDTLYYVIEHPTVLCSNTSSTISETACDSYTSPSGKHIWTSTNTYLDTIPNAANCDSVITVNLTINNASTSTITETACDSYTSPSGKHIWTSSNTYLDTIPNAVNCDSVITVNLTINNASSSNIYSFEYDGKTYEVVRENKTWEDAAACAVLRGGILAEINDDAENTALFNELSTNANIVISNTVAPDGGGGSYVWIGGNDLGNEGDWVWNGDNDNDSTQFWQGTALGSVVGGIYNNWGTSNNKINEPDDSGGQDALGLALTEWPFNFPFFRLGNAGQWNDVDHTNTLYYVIEHPTVLCSNTSSTISETACDSYTSPSGKHIWTSTNTYLDTHSQCS